MRCTYDGAIGNIEGGWADDDDVDHNTPTVGKGSEAKSSSKTSHHSKKRKRVSKSKMNATRLDFMPELSPPPNKGKKDFTSAWLDVQRQTLVLEQEKIRRKMEIQEQQAMAMTAKEQKQHQLSTQIAKANFVAELSKSGRDMEDIKEMISLVFPDQ